MALLTRGSSRCVICGEIIQSGQDALGFSPFVANELDPLFLFSDDAMHADCFDHDPRSAAARERYATSRRILGPGHRQCAVCKLEIVDPDEYFTLGFLTEDEHEPAAAFNYTQLHRSHVSEWPERRQAIAALEQLQASGKWRGRALDDLIAALAA